ncbi:FecR family protein [Flagellimonas sp.]|uniref:FecR family protein n=1 Tax=Flagellimonas sp. TaxID=2058762 RepID=UPI003B59C1EC
MEELTRKYFTNSLSRSESEKLLELLQKPSNQKLFKKYAKDYHDLNLSFQEIDLEKEYLALLKKNRNIESSQKTSRGKWYFRAAAALIILFGMGYYYVLTSKNSSIEKQDLPQDVITITLDNGEVKIIQEDGAEKILDKNGQIVGKQEGRRINYSNAAGDNATEKLVYNELAVPNGKTFQLKLSDGSSVHLNAGSTLKYPVKFLHNENRRVFLDGEAYFEIAKDEAHPFVVNTSQINIMALGTEFNVNSYDGDVVAHAVLVEGSVALYDGDATFEKEVSTILSPNEKATWGKSEKNVRVDEVEVHEYIAWTKGQLLFKIRPFSEIIKVLERHYDVAITNNYHHLDNLRFFATFDIETIDQVMESFQNSEPFSFVRNGNHIIINGPN